MGIVLSYSYNKASIRRKVSDKAQKDGWMECINSTLDS